MGDNETDEYEVGHWRLKFKELRPKLDRKWMQQVGAFEAYYSTATGLNMLLQVQKGRASLVNTRRVVQTVESLITGKAKHKKKPLAQRQKLARL